MGWLCPLPTWHQMELSTHVVWNGTLPFDIGIIPTNEGINECENH